MGDSVIIEFVGDTSKLEEAYGRIENSQNEVSAAFKKANADMQSSTADTTDEVQQLSDTFRNLSSLIKAGILKPLLDEAAQTTKSANTLSGQLQQLTDALAKMRAEGKEGSKDFKNMQDEALKLQKALEVTRESLKNLSTQFGGLKAAGEVLHGISRALEASAAASHLFGEKNEELEQAIGKLADVMKVVNGLQEAAAVLGESSLLRTYASAAAIKLQAAAESESTVVRWAAVAAQTALNTVMEANPIALVIGAIAALAAGMTIFGKNTDEATRAQEKLNEELNNEIDNAGIIDIEYRRAIGQITEFEEQKLKLRKDYADKEKEVKKQTKKDLDELDKGQSKIKAIFNAADGDGGNDANAEYYKTRGEIEQHGQEMRFTLQSEYSKKKEEINIREAQANLDNAKKEQQTEIERQIAHYKERLAIVQKGSKEELDKKIAEITAEGKLQKSQLTEDMAAASKRKQIDAETNKVIAEERLKYNLQNLELAKQSCDAQNLLVQKGSEAELQVKMKDLQMQAEIDKIRLGNVANRAQIEQNIDAKLMADSLALQKQYHNQWEQNEDAAAVAIVQTKINTFKEGTQQLLDAVKELAQAQAQVEIDTVTQTVDDAKLRTAKIDEIISALKNKLYALDKDAAAKNKATNTPAQPKEDDKARQQLEQQAQLEKSIQQQALKFARDTSNKIFEIENETRNARYNAEINNLQKQSSFQLNNNNLTQAQKIAIRKKYDKQIAAIKLQQWKADQKSKEEQAVINGALAVTNILATMPWTTFGITQAIAIAGAVASTAAQVAAIAAQKPPQFATGTPAGKAATPAGFKLVGEQGPEFIYTPGGERVVDAHDTAALLNRWGIPSYSTPMPSVDAEMVRHLTATSTQPAINEDTLAKKIAVEMSKATKPVFNWDKNGFTTHLVTMGSKKTIVNNKYSA